jgi:cyclopropane fatty-acyl-phospholipid synthase-like methyltransferase
MTRMLISASLAMTVIATAGVLGQRAPRAPSPPTITAEAKDLNEQYKTNCQRFIVGFESPGRELFDKRVKVVDALGLKPGMRVADVGAGSGFLALLMAQRVGPTGTVYAEDISPCLLDHIARTASAMKLTNVKTVLGGVNSPRLPERSLDAVLIAETYHHFENPRSMMDEIKKALRKDGVLWVIDEDRVEGLSPKWLLDEVRAGKGTFTDEIRNRGFELVDELDLMDFDYVLKFKQREAVLRPPSAPR